MVGGNVAADAYGQGHYETEAELEHEFSLLRKPFLVVLEHLDIVVGEAYSAAPDRRQDEQLDIDVAEVAYQQYGNQQRNQNDDSTHGRGALLLHLTRKAEVAYAFADLLALQPSDDAASCEKGDQHAQHDGGHGPEREVGHQPDSGESRVLQIIE